jgi:adenylylsulfate kinase
MQMNNRLPSGEERVRYMGNEKSQDVYWHNQAVTTQDLETLHKHKGATLWFTGLSASGKSTLANAVARTLHEKGISTIVLDGDNIRHGLNKDLGFSPEDRVENIRRIGEVAKLFTSAAVINLTAFISPYRQDRETARNLQPETFIEVFCDAGLDVCEDRDPKGLYKKARANLIKDFTGINAPYEAPEKAEIRVDTGHTSIEECIEVVLGYLREKKIIG